MDGEGIVTRIKNYREIYVSPYRDIWISTMFLCVLGLMMIFSASGSVDYFKRQLTFVLLGFLVCFMAQFMDYHMLYFFTLNTSRSIGNWSDQVVKALWSTVSGGRGSKDWNHCNFKLHDTTVSEWSA